MGWNYVFRWSIHTSFNNTNLRLRQQQESQLWREPFVSQPFVKITNGSKLLTIFAKSTILDPAVKYCSPGRPEDVPLQRHQDVP